MFGISVFGDFCYGIQFEFFEEISGTFIYYMEGEDLNNFTSQYFRDNLSKIVFME